MPMARLFVVNSSACPTMVTDHPPIVPIMH